MFQFPSGTVSVSMYEPHWAWLVFMSSLMDTVSVLGDVYMLSLSEIK